MTAPLATLPEIALGLPWAAPSSREERRVLSVVRWPVGGIRTHILYTYPMLAQAGYRFTFVGPDNDTLRTFAQSLGELEGCEFVGVPTRGRGCPLWRAVRSLARQGRFGMIHSHGLTAAVHAVLGNFGLGLPHLTTVHDVFRRDQFAGWKGPLKRWALAHLVGRISTIVSVSNDVRANLIEYLPSLARHPLLKVISNGIDAGRYRPGPVRCELRTRLALCPETVLLGFLGRFMEQKGFTTLLQALEILRREGAPRPFHLVAIESGDHRRRSEREIATRNLTDCVTVLDFMPDVLPVLRQLDLLVVPSLWEASSLLSMEAMCVGIPVLGSDCIGLREVLHGTPSRMFRAGDPVSLASALRQALPRPWFGQAAPSPRQRETASIAGSMRSSS